jgi:hypothetical protein
MHQTLGKAERGTTSPSIESLNQIAKAWSCRFVSSSQVRERPMPRRAC